MARKRSHNYNLFLAFAIVASVLAATGFAYRSWILLSAAALFFGVDFFKVSPKYYRQVAEELKTYRNIRLIAGMVVIVIFSMATEFQWKRWNRQEILRNGLPAAATVTGVHQGSGKYSPQRLELWYQHPQKGRQFVIHTGPIKHFWGIEIGQTLAVHYHPRHPSKVAIDGREEDIYSGFLLASFLIVLGLWFGLRLRLSKGK